MTATIYKRKKDAKLVASLITGDSGKKTNIQRVQVINEIAACKLKMVIRPDVSIASRSPKKGDSGWAILSEDKNSIEKRYSKAISFLKNTNHQ